MKDWEQRADAESVLADELMEKLQIALEEATSRDQEAERTNTTCPTIK